MRRASDVLAITRWSIVRGQGGAPLTGSPRLGVAMPD